MCVIKHSHAMQQYADFYCSWKDQLNVDCAQHVKDDGKLSAGSREPDKPFTFHKQPYFSDTFFVNSK